MAVTYFFKTYIQFVNVDGLTVKWYHHIYVNIEMKWYSLMVRYIDTQSWMFEAMTVPSKLSKIYRLLLILKSIK